jgi:hypothetical protein
MKAMTTNETFFFRDKIPFDHLKDAVLPALVQARAVRRSLRIWCAASLSGGKAAIQWRQTDQKKSTGSAPMATAAEQASPSLSSVAPTR